MGTRLSLAPALVFVAIATLATGLVRAAFLPPVADPLAPLGIAAQGSSLLTIANLDTSQPARALVDFARQPTADRTQHAPPLMAPLEAVDIDLACDTALRAGAYAATSTADRSIASQALTLWPTSGGMAAYEESRPSTDVIVPLVVKDYQRRASLVSVQNTNPSTSVLATVELHGSGDVAPLYTTAVDIPPGGSRTLDLLRDTDTFPSDRVPRNFRGWMRIQGASPLAVQSFVDVMDQMMAVSAFEGVPAEAAAERLFVPKFSRTATSKTSLVLLNHHPTPVDVTLDFLGWEGMCTNASFTLTRTLAAAEVLYLGSQPDELATPLPADCSAAIVVNANAPLVGLVVDRDQVVLQSYTMRLEAAYVASSASEAAQRTLVPTFRRTFGSASGAVTSAFARIAAPPALAQPSAGTRSSSLFAMNINPATATATLELFDAAGQPITTCGDACLAEIGPYSTHPWLASELDALPDGTDGRALVSSDLPLVVAVAEVGGSSDLTMLRGIPVPEGPRAVAAQLPSTSSFVPFLTTDRECRHPTATATPEHAVTPTATEPAEPSPTPECSRHNTKMSLAASATEIGVGQLVTVTARLENVGCGMVGLLLYRLEQEPGVALLPVSPVTVSHPVGLRSGQFDEALFTLRGVRGGMDQLRVRVSFEVHLGYPGPAYWAAEMAGPIAIRVRDVRNYLPLAAVRHEFWPAGP